MSREFGEKNMQENNIFDSYDLTNPVFMIYNNK
jgi:hypothetical protein